MSVYGKGRKYGSQRISRMKLALCEGHVLGQVYSAVRGYVWKDKVLYFKHFIYDAQISFTAP